MYMYMLYGCTSVHCVCICICCKPVKVYTVNIYVVRLYKFTLCMYMLYGFTSVYCACICCTALQAYTVYVYVYVVRLYKCTLCMYMYMLYSYTSVHTVDIYVPLNSLYRGLCPTNFNATQHNMAVYVYVYVVHVYNCSSVQVNKCIKLNFTCHLWPITCHVSCVTCQISPVTYANSHSHRPSP